MSTDLYRNADTAAQVQSVVSAVGVICGAFGLGILLAAVGFSVANFFGVTQETAPVLVYVGSSALQFVGFIAAVVAYVQLSHDYDLIEYRRPTLADVGWTIGGLVALFLVALAISAVASALGVENAQNQVIVQGQENPDVFLYMIPVTILLVGPGEELLFRGVVQGKLRQTFGAIPAIVGASALFGVVHVVAIIGSGSSILLYIALAGALGIVLGAVYEHTENILVPIVIHGVWNAMTFLGQWAIAVYDLPAAA